MSLIISSIKKDLLAQADEKVKLSGERFFKETVKMYGVKNPITRKIAQKYFKEIKNKDKNDILNLCEQLWQSDIFEQSLIACHWSYAVRKQYSVNDFKIFERWVKKYVSNWASCDTLCNHTIGEVVEKYPKLIFKLKIWTKSHNKWVRRAAAVSLIVPAKKGLFLSDILEIAELLLLDEDDLVQKGYGWMLKVASKKNQQTIYDFVIRNKLKMSRTALRYAIEKMPAHLRKKAMQIGATNLL
ncbi:DNA alkylation repair protein [Patescibacteria group bacterium]|nr:DNA alkylation repair protein [Patescibacteria group bacterium]MBU1885853.1 DNA alkylation repair protein [Patescibacteria group bacterium]